MSASYEELFDSSVAFEKHNWTPDALTEIPTCKGVLLFRDLNRKPIQLLQAANLRRTVRSKLFGQDENTPKKLDITNLVKQIFWRCCYNDFMSQAVYIYLADALFGKQADEWVQLPSPCFSYIELSNSLPYFDVTNHPAISDTRVVLGLFPNRKSGTEYSNALNSAFCLCQNPKLLNSGRESTCPYLQMASCPGPCLDPAQQERYRQSCFEAIECAKGRIEPSLAVLAQHMDEASHNMNFEAASKIKKQIQQLEKLQKPGYRRVHDLRNLSILHVDRAFKISIQGHRKKVQQYQWFKVDSGAIYDLGTCSPKSQQDIDLFLQKNWTTGSKVPFPENKEKHFANLSFFLYRSKRSGIWIDCSGGILGNQLYPEVEHLLGKELPEGCAEERDTK
jgi:hypothetical protein